MLNSIKRSALFLAFAFFAFAPHGLWAQESENPDVSPSLIQDRNGDGIIRIDAFGDSITRGVGDFTGVGLEVEEPSKPTGEAGYPLRIETLLGVPVSNLGIPGEREATNGLRRFASMIPGRGSDVIIVSGGTNDAIDLLSTSDFFRAVQTMINIGRAEGAQMVLVTPPPSCCDGSSLSPIINNFGLALQELAGINDLPFANTRKAFNNTCGSSDESCFLLNSPEGIHPNTAGYDVMAETIIATLFSIDIFAADGPSLLEQALDLPAGTVLTVPDFTPVAVPSSDSEQSSSNDDSGVPQATTVETQS